jgi:hypothetical protein
MSRGLFRLVGVWSGCWVVRVTHVSNIHHYTAEGYTEDTSVPHSRNYCHIRRLYSKKSSRLALIYIRKTWDKRSQPFASHRIPSQGEIYHFQSLLILHALYFRP